MSANCPEARSAEGSHEREGPLPSANCPEARSAEGSPVRFGVPPDDVLRLTAFSCMPSAIPEFDQPGPAAPRTWSVARSDPPRLWFTTGRGILNEVYYPRADIPQIRDLGFIVADGDGFWVEVKRLNAYRVRLPSPGIPAVEFIHTHPRFELRLRIAPDPERDVLLVEVVLSADPDLRPYALLAPHLGGTGNDNLAETGLHRGRRMLWAEQGPFALALAAANAQQGDAWGATSAGYVGASDGWQDFAAQWRADLELRHGRSRERGVDRRAAGERNARTGLRHQPRIGRDARRQLAGPALHRRVGSAGRAVARRGRRC